MIRRPPRSTQGVSSAASDVYKRQALSGAPAKYIKHQDHTAEDLWMMLKGFDDKNYIMNTGAREDNHGVVRGHAYTLIKVCLLYTSPSPRDLSTSRMPSSA
eukprot:TRINITY_DN5322_c0_g1_i3.p3 TRINITY_DN5322_c0_g1~~TRINITY_DN5322_c0_g1_i3.p3  ORF type:complete len:101 (-),score=26.52 TRINITY_DN5322_c0_g1_i3:139-441(-)